MPIEHVFVLMLENRSFDHMFGLSGLQGTDAVTGQLTRINGLFGTEINSWNNKNCTVSSNVVDPMKVDPAHEFDDVLEQLCGHGSVYSSQNGYPPINNSGYVSNFVESAQKKIARQKRTYCDVMQYFPPPRMPNLYALAKEFALCDAWYSSMPGPTWPNRFFAVAASSGGLDRSPKMKETASWQVGDGFKIQNGTLFDIGRNPARPGQQLKWRIYSGFKLVAFVHALHGIQIGDITSYSQFAYDVQNPAYDAQFTWIEPNYGVFFSNFKFGNSQHPLDGVPRGERLIKDTYLAIRNSPIWDTSMLIITWDEHGGFYDHAIPPKAIPPGDNQVMPDVNESGFLFDQYGPRVPAIIVSPLIPKNVIDHRPYDHSSIPATVEKQFNLAALTDRDKNAHNLLSLASLPEPRDVPDIFEPATPEEEAALAETPMAALDTELPDLTAADKLTDAADVSARDEPVEADHNLPGFIYLAARTDVQLRQPRAFRLIHSAFVSFRMNRIRTRGQARDYFEEVRRKLAAAEAEAETVR